MAEAKKTILEYLHGSSSDQKQWRQNRGGPKVPQVLGTHRGGGAAPEREGERGRGIKVCVKLSVQCFMSAQTSMRVLLTLVFHFLS